MENTPRAPSGCAPSAGLIIVVGGLLLTCVGMPWVYFVRDYDYVQGTARRVQDAGALATEALAFGLVGLLVIAGLAGLVGVVGLFTRWASPLARVAATQIAIARAQHMELPEGLSTYNVTNNYRGAREPLPVELHEPAGQQTVIDAPPSVPALPGPVSVSERFTPGMSRLAQLVARGEVDLSGEQLLAGYDAEGAPAVLDIPAWALMLVAGQSGKGKSTLAGLIISQAALRGWEIFVCDPAYHRPRSLLREYLAGMTGAIYRQAVTPAEIAHTIALVTRIARRRIDGEAWSQHVLLVVDDFSVLAGGGALDEVIDELALVTLQCSAAGVHILLIAHDLTGDWFGGKIAKRLRGAGNIRAVFNMLPDAAAPILPSTKIARQVAVLPPGQALFFNGADAPALITVPWLRAEDLAHAAQGQPPRLYQPFTPRPLAPYTPPAPRPAEEGAAEMATPEPPSPPRAAPPTQRLPEQPLREQIVELLALAQGELDAETIASRLGAQLPTVKSRLSELIADELISFRRAGRRYQYAIVRRPPAA